MALYLVKHRDNVAFTLSPIYVQVSGEVSSIGVFRLLFCMHFSFPLTCYMPHAYHCNRSDRGGVYRYEIPRYATLSILFSVLFSA